MIAIDKRRKYSRIKLFVCIYIEKVHRYVYDNIYYYDKRKGAGHKVTWHERPIVKWYDIIYKIYPDFRPYLKHWKKVYARAYNQKRISITNHFILDCLAKINTERYSSYV